MDVSGVDFPEREKRFEVVYHLLSIKHAGRIRVKTYAGEADPIPSAVEVFRGADWYTILAALSVRNMLTLSSGMSEKLGICSAFSSRTTRTCMPSLKLFSCPS